MKNSLVSSALQILLCIMMWYAAEAEDRIAASPSGPAESGTSEDYFNFNSSTPGGSQGKDEQRLLL